jgi:preprotein translocase subunit SecG
MFDPVGNHTDRARKETMPSFLMTLLMLSGVVLMFIVLLQRGRGGGLAGAFGGAGGQSVLGVKAGDVFTKITIGVALFWVILAGVSGLAARNASHQYDDSAATTDDDSAEDDSSTKGDTSDPKLQTSDEGSDTESKDGESKDAESKDAESKDSGNPFEPADEESKSASDAGDSAASPAAQPTLTVPEAAPETKTSDEAGQSNSGTESGSNSDQ